MYVANLPTCLTPTPGVWIQTLQSEGMPILTSDIPFLITFTDGIMEKHLPELESSIDNAQFNSLNDLTEGEDISTSEPSS